MGAVKSLPDRLREASGYALMDAARVTVLEAAEEIERLRAVTEPMPKEKRAEVSDGRPVAWGLPNADGDEIWATSLNKEAIEQHCPTNQTLVPLYRSPQSTLTDAEREAVESAIWDYEQNDDDDGCARMVATLRGLLERLK